MLSNLPATLMVVEKTSPTGAMGYRLPTGGGGSSGVPHDLRSLQSFTYLAWLFNKFGNYPHHKEDSE